MNKKDTQYFKEKLLKEKALLNDELKTIGRSDPENPSDWNATPGKIETDSADENENADKLEELSGNAVLLSKLEPQFNAVKAALARIELGTYGLCEVCNVAIEKERLEANPSATTCLQHMNVK